MLPRMSPEVAPASTTESSAMRRKRGGWRRVIVVVVLGCLVTLGTAWGPGAAASIGQLLKGSREGLWLSGMGARQVVDEELRIIGSHRASYWRDCWEIGPVQNEWVRVADCGEVHQDQLPAWVVHPPARFDGGFTPPGGITARTNARGVPWRCLKDVVLTGREGAGYAVQRYGIWIWERGDDWLALPLLPIWPGLLGNIAVWSAAAFLLLWSPNALRRARRRRGGRCEACGYALMGLREGRCPECGGEGPLPPKAPGAPQA